MSEDALKQLVDTLLNGPSRYVASHHITDWLAAGIVLGSAMAELLTLYTILFGIFTFFENIDPLFRAFVGRLGAGEKAVPQAFLELVFPVATAKSAFATEQLHLILRGVVKYYGFWDRLAARKKSYSLELVGTNDEGIRYILMIPASEVDNVQRDLISFLPGLKVRQAKDYTLKIPAETTNVVELRLSADFILPLKDHKALDEHDLMAHLTGHMTKLLPDELVSFQIVAVPVFRETHLRTVRRQQHIESRIALGKEVWSQLKRQRTPLGYALWLLWYPPLYVLQGIAKVFAAIVGVIGIFLSPGHELPGFMDGNDKRRSDNPYEVEMSKLVKDKLDQQLFEVTLRILVSSPDAARRGSRIDALVGAFRPLRSTYQSIGVRQQVPFLSSKRKNLAQFKLRELAPHHLSQQTILSSSELSDLYHFPNTDITKTEGLVKSRSRELAAPLSMRRSTTDLDVIVGTNTHGGSDQPIGVTLAQRQKHMYVIGKTGTGKTTLLTSMIYQDMVNGKGLAVLDPHGDMFREVLSIVPEDRREDVVVFDPSDREYPVGLNILDPGVEFANEDDRAEWITSMVLSVFQRLADEKLWGPRMEHILRNATLTALQVPNPSLYTIQRLLTEKSYQREVTKGLTDPVLKQFWVKEFKLLGTMQLSNVVAPLTHRLGHFITTKMSRHILLQEKSTLRIADIMDQGKILLINLSKGDIGEDQSSFFGTILSSLIWMAAYQRTKLPEPQRNDFFLYVDEFQNFATKQFTDITSEGRKFHISLIASHQNVAQIEDKSILKIVAGNAHTLICLKASPDDESFILPFMAPEVEKGDIVNLAPYHFYMKTTTDESEEACSGVTVPVRAEGSDKNAAMVIGQSRKQYGTPLEAVEESLQKLFVIDEAPKSKKRATVRKVGSKQTKVSIRTSRRKGVAEG